MAARFRRLRASHLTTEIVSWTIGIVAMLAISVLVTALAHQLGWSWP